MEKSNISLWVPRGKQSWLHSKLKVRRSLGDVLWNLSVVIRRLFCWTIWLSCSRSIYDWLIAMGMHAYSKTITNWISYLNFVLHLIGLICRLLGLDWPVLLDSRELSLNSFGEVCPYVFLFPCLHIFRIGQVLPCDPILGFPLSLLWHIFSFPSFQQFGDDCYGAISTQSSR